MKSCSTCNRATINTHKNLHCNLLGRPVPLAGRCSAHDSAVKDLTKACCVCGLILHDAGAGAEVTHGFCEDCREWNKQFNRRKFQGDATATREEFDREVEARRKARF
jgi:hypothetical protein